MRFVLFLFTIIIVMSCEYNNYMTSDKERLANEVTKKVAIQLYKEKGLYPCGSGGQAMNEIKMLALSFDYYKPIEIEDGRELLVSAANRFVNEINSEKRIRDYLYNYPFRPYNIEVRIFLKNPDGSKVSSGKLRVLSMIEGELKYKIGDPETGLFKTICEETYEEALQKLENKIELLTVPSEQGRFN